MQAEMQAQMEQARQQQAEALQALQSQMTQDREAQNALFGQMMVSFQNLQARAAAQPQPAHPVPALTPAALGPQVNRGDAQPQGAGHSAEASHRSRVLSRQDAHSSHSSIEVLGDEHDFDVINPAGTLGQSH